MKIITESIKDISQDFGILKCMLVGANYGVTIECKVFVYLNDGASFTIENLQKLFDGDPDYEPVMGTIEAANYTASRNIDVYLSYSPDPEAKKVYGHDWYIVSRDEHWKRKNHFWEKIRAHCRMPPLYIYQHLPEVGSRFHDFLYWEFTYIFVNDNIGTVIHMSAYD